MKQIFYAFSFVTILGCSSPQKTNRDLVGDLDVSVRVDINLQANSSILLTYTFSKPVMGFKFLRDYSKYRREFWQPIENDIEIVANESGLEVVKSEAGQAFSSASFSVSTVKGMLRADYDPIFPFSNGEALIYPQQFVVIPLRNLDGFKNWKPLEDFRLPASQNIIVSSAKFSRGIFDGEQHGLPYDVTNLLKTPTDGPYVYVGEQTPFRDSKYGIIFEPNTPTWVRASISREFPRAMELLEKKLSAPPLKIPYIFVIRVTSESDKSPNVRGSASQGVKVSPIVLMLRGEGWNKADSKKKEKLNLIIVHEPIHLWNSPSIADFAPIAWMYEGGAEALRVRTEFAMKIRTLKEYQEIHSEFAQQCVEKYVPPLSLATMKVIPTYRLVYDCGLLLGLVTEQILVDKDYFKFWAELLRRARLKDMKYGLEDYFELLNERSSNKSVIAKIRGFIENPQQDRRAELVQLLKVAGIKVLVENPIKVEPPNPN